MKKRVLFLVFSLILCLSVFGFVGCNKDNNTADPLEGEYRANGNIFFCRIRTIHGVYTGDVLDCSITQFGETLSQSYALTKINDTKYEFLENETDTEKSTIIFNSANKSFTINFKSGNVLEFEHSDITYEEWSNLF